ncbi:MAG: hypothetical protein HWE10_00100 [Gammaproteobacteria bacterium]|nr:hypothetical protein [Gammaproteobacteria bacterium]
MNILKQLPTLNTSVESNTCLVEDTSDNVQEISQHIELIRIIKRHELCHGWTLLIAPDHLPKKHILVDAGINLDKVLIIHKKNCCDVLFKAYQALKQDNFSALVIWDNLLTESESALLNIKAQHTTTSLYLLHHKAHDPDLIAH